MTTTEDRTYNDIALGLKLEYIRLAGEELRVRLFPEPKRYQDAKGEWQLGPTPFPLPVGLDYLPGDGTSYRLIFTPVRSIRQVSAIVNTEYGVSSVPSGCFDSDGNVREPGMVLVTKYNGTLSDWTFLVDLSMERGYLAPYYVAEKVRDNLATATAITALLRAVAGQELLDPIERSAAGD